MNTGLILTFGSLGFMMLLLVAYYSQQLLSTIGSKMYRVLLVVVVMFLITEVATSFYFTKGGSIVITNIVLRIHWFVEILWFLGLYIYNVCFLKDVNAKTIKELITTDKRCAVMTIFTLIITIIYLFIPFPEMNYETFSYLPGAPVYYIFIYCFIVDAAINILMFKRKNEISSRSRNAVYIMNVEKIMIFILQIIFPRTAILGLGSALQMFFLYFYIENPDLAMINSLGDLQKEIERSNLAKSDFLSNMSHEIRSPMNAIVGFSETILHNPNYDEASIRTDIMHIATAGNNLLGIIDNILDISKIESGVETLEEKEYSVGNVVMELGSIIESRLANRPIKFITEVDPQIPKSIYGDQTKIFQVLLNILTNSIKYTEVGKIKLEVTKEIKKEIKASDVILTFKISDTGFGIKEEDYNKLFEKFSRLSSATTNEIEGTGLGLVITKKYVDLLGGKIWFESEYGVGTTFYIQISQRIVDATPLGNIRENKEEEDKVKLLDCTGYRILVVDDNLLNLKVAKKILADYKFTVETLTSGKECVYKIKEGQQYDMIFLDHMMPEMDGIEVLHILQKLEGYKIPPIIALTANAISGAKDMYLNEGFNEYLSKPINRIELNKLIHKYFEAIIKAKETAAPAKVEEQLQQTQTQTA